eukprot:Lithocolla_globosa_v1_NODE_6679_length_1051_cov_377.237186.p1 type:complete len:250 gc:universal NODE_6679_length_1051_cov_377.237186:273-1022(+)
MSSSLFFINIFLCAKKRSGKTSVISHILKKCIDKKTRVVVFCPTADKDPTWQAIQESLEKRKIQNEFHTSLGPRGIILDNLIDELQQEKLDSDTEDDEDEPEKIIEFGDNQISVRIRKYKPKKISPKIVIICDDVGGELRSKSVSRLLKIHRHLRSKVILSSQYFNDIDPAARRQLDYFLIFQGINLQKLEEMHRQADLDVSFEKFTQMYKQATSINSFMSQLRAVSLGFPLTENLRSVTMKKKNYNSL